MFQIVTESLAIGSVISIDGLSEAAEKGYRTIIDLCTPAEANQLDAEEVRKLGFNYISLPVDRQNLNSEILPTFIQVIDSAPKPIYTRCASGLRAGVMTLLTLAIQQGWTQQEYLERRQSLGLEHKPNCPLAAFAQDYFQAHSI